MCIRDRVYTGTSSDPDTCPSSAYFADGTVFVADPCGNDYYGEIRTFNPTTWAQGPPITTVFYDPAFMVQGTDGNLYVTNFGYGLVSVVNPTTGAFVKYFETCYYYPDYLDVQTSTGVVYIGDLYAGWYHYFGENPRDGCMDAYNIGSGTDTIIVLSNAAGTGYGSATGVSVNQENGYVYAVDSFSYFEGTTNNVYLISGTSQTGNLTLSSNGFQPWGSAYDAANHDVLVVISEDDTCSGFCGGFQSISSANVVSSSIIDTGLGPSNACYNSGRVVTIPNYDTEAPAYATNVKADFALKQVDLNNFGYIGPGGCGGS